VGLRETLNVLEKEIYAG